jgi:hypothetical protein
MFLFLGMGGFVRREAAVPAEFAWSMPWLMFFALTIGFGQIVFAYNLFSALILHRSTNGKTTDNIQATQIA